MFAKRVVFLMKKAMIIIAMLALLAACKQQAPHSILPEGCVLEEGDLVFRRGNGMTSRAVLAVDRHGSYSHIGIAVDSCGTIMIVHAVPGEPDYEGDPDRVKMESPEKFYSSLNARIGEVRRLHDNRAAASEAARHALEVYRRGTLFDHDYDDSDTTKMYCCELITFAYGKAGIRLTDGKRHRFKLPGMKPICCILPSDICNSRMLTKIISF